MKKILMFALASTIVSATPAIAGNLTCKYPKECVQPLGSKYSTGGGNKAIQYVQLDCRDSKGYMISFIDEMGSLSGLLGFGRLTMPNKLALRQAIKERWNVNDSKIAPLPAL